MIKLVIEIGGESGRSIATLEGVSNGKKELYALLGVMDDMKFKVLSSIQDGENDHSFMVTEKKKLGDNYGNNNKG